MELVSVIIINYRGRKFLERCLESVFLSSYKNIEVLVVDNSFLKEDRMVLEKFPKVRIIKNRKNLGFCKGANKGARMAKGRYFLFLNNDTVIEKKAIEELVKRIKSDKKIGVCGCRMVSYQEEEFFHCGVGVDVFGFPVNKRKVFYVEGAAFFTRKDLFFELRGFDEEFFMFGEDIDFCWRCWLLGWKVVVVSEAVVRHKIGKSAGGNIYEGRYKTTKLRRFLSERNCLRMLLKNYKIGSLLIILPGYFFINFIEIVFFAMVLKPAVSFCYMRAFIWNVTNLKGTFTKRQEVQRKREIGDREIIRGMYKGSGKLTALLKVGIPRIRE